MRALVPAGLAGALFGVGLIISGMTQQAKVVGFLDVFGAWDPSLAFVMIGAIGVCLPAFRRVLRLRRPLFVREFQVPARKQIDRDLILGAAVFGVGWGISGFCPGPAIVSLGTGALPTFVFVGAMIVGMRMQRAARSPRA
jgi:uncharacterized membrane protein YedE/YeeE